MSTRDHLTRLPLFACALAAAYVSLSPQSDASTPWAMIARRAIGRVEQLSQQPKGDQPGFDVATVILNAEAAKVYTTAVGLLQKNQQVHVVSEDATARTIQFTNGARSASIRVSDLGPRLSQMVVASAVLPGQDSATIQIADRILRVCQEMRVTCSAR